jgi:hypothetical protein
MDLEILESRLIARKIYPDHSIIPWWYCSLVYKIFNTGLEMRSSWRSLLTLLECEIEFIFSWACLSSCKVWTNSNERVRGNAFQDFKRCVHWWHLAIRDKYVLLHGYTVSFSSSKLSYPQLNKNLKWCVAIFLFYFFAKNKFL